MIIRRLTGLFGPKEGLGDGKGATGERFCSDRTWEGTDTMDMEAKIRRETKGDTRTLLLAIREYKVQIYHSAIKKSTEN